VKEIRIDCDNDTVLLKIDQKGGAACHTGNRSCFFRRLDKDSIKIMGKPACEEEEAHGK
jgi:phosphoribosyl-AMP cyclohydrolase